jgi:hypothetical protein
MKISCAIFCHIDAAARAIHGPRVPVEDPPTASEAALCIAAKIASLFDQFIGGREQSIWDLKSKRPRSLRFITSSYLGKPVPAVRPGR